MSGVPELRSSNSYVQYVTWPVKLTKYYFITKMINKTKKVIKNTFRPCILHIINYLSLALKFRKFRRAHSICFKPILQRNRNIASKAST